MKLPLVSVICLCYNHEKFVIRSVESVLEQTYSSIEIIIVDDASSDGSQAKITSIKNHPQITEIVFLPENKGNCHAFNRGLALAKGEFVIDLATDDVLMPDRIEKQVNFFQNLHDNVGVIFSNVSFIDEEDNHLGYHYPINENGRARIKPAEGEIFKELIARYFISPPSMMIRSRVFSALNGYDESLAYEDYDFWVRSSRSFAYAYQDEVLTEVRKVKGSLSSGWYQRGDAQLLSTYKVCQKVRELVRTSDENLALVFRLKYEIRQAVFSGNYKEAGLFYNMLKEIQTPGMIYRFLSFINNLKLPLAWVRKLYYFVRY